MGRPLGIKRGNRKRKEKYDAEIEEGEREQEPQPKQLKADDVSIEEEAENQEKQSEEVEDDAVHQLEGIPLGPVQSQGSKNIGVTFVLEKASLEVAKVGKTYQILNSDDHANFLKRNGRNPADYRPDIVHQALLAILDSPLNKAGKVRAVYVRTEKGVLFEVKPHVRIPRTYKRFSGIMLQLLQKLSITAAGKREKLLRVIKNPVTQYLPANARRIGFSHSSEKLVEMQDYVAAIGDDSPLVFVVGAMAHGKIQTEYTDDFISISNYPLSAACCINMICDAVRKHLKFI
ncbi:ribosomal RNA small subunit methyltransferase NEP1-like [Rhodamnia argentea]|uniref:Ribosomal RNA small subunit methyltransferase NEP1-like n=1 Tax=Rhodamnia argentea TaxID=178133 RepID=A0A8B8P1Q7_9MYRT|nr:ribosomal RNA small subunit methyltransferase NEP1-like [Rhodamnia argentea]XP_030528717.1 ribosomal RNA small subunit methyltransferase NEP1-like [Rhodamnia argentea]